MPILEQRIISMYQEGKSPYEIAEVFKTNAMRIRRILQKNGVIIRDKSDAQRLALETGRSKHPHNKKRVTEEDTNV